MTLAFTTSFARVGTCNVAAKFLGMQPFVLKSIPVAVAEDSYSAQDDFAIDDFSSSAHPFWRNGTTPFTPMCANASAAGNGGGYAAAPKKSFEQLEASKVELTDVHQAQRRLINHVNDPAFVWKTRYVRRLIELFDDLMNKSGDEAVAVNALKQLQDHLDPKALKRFERILVEHIKEHEHGVDAVPAYVILAVTKLNALTPSATAALFRSLLRSKAWESIEEVLDHVALRSKQEDNREIQIELESDLAQHIELYGADALPANIIVTTMSLPYIRARGASTFFRALLGIGAWDEAMVLLDSADECFNEEIVKALGNALAQHIKEHGVAKVPYNAVMATYSSSDDTTPLAPILFDALFKVNAWDEVSSMWQYANEKFEFGCNFQNRLQRALAEHIDKHGAGNVSPQVFVSALTSYGGTDFVASKLFKYLLEKGAWNEVKEVLLHTNEHQYTYNAKQEFDRALIAYVQGDVDSDIPTFVLEAAVESTSSAYMSELYRILFMRIMNEFSIEESDIMPDVISDLPLLAGSSHDFPLPPAAQASSEGVSGEYGIAQNVAPASRQSHSKRSRSESRGENRATSRKKTDNHFEVLGLEPTMDISDKTLKEALVRLIWKFHPDRFPRGSEDIIARATAQTKLITVAYETLLDPNKRRKYLRELGYQV